MALLDAFKIPNLNVGAPTQSGILDALKRRREAAIKPPTLSAAGTPAVAPMSSPVPKPTAPVATSQYSASAGPTAKPSVLPKAPVQPTVASASPLTGNVQTPSGATVNAGTGALMAPPPTTPSATSPLASVIASRAAPTSSRQALTDRLAAASAKASGFDPSARRTELTAAAGLDKTKATIGTFEDEVAKANTLLDNLESDIKQRTGDFLVTDPQARRLQAAESAPILKNLGIAERGYSAASNRLERGNADINQTVANEQAAAERPLSFLSKEIGIGNDIKTATADEVKSSREAALSHLYKQGITDPNQLYDYANFDQTGKQVGDISMSEISDFVKAASGTESKKSSLEIKKLEADIAETTDPLVKQKKLAEIAQIKSTTAKNLADAAKTTAESSTAVSPAKQSEALGNMQLVKDIEANAGAIFGPIQTGYLPFTAGAETANKYDQLKGILSLDNRTKLKGSGAISDFESRTLEKAASSLGRNLDETAGKKELARIRGVFTTAAGQKATVSVTDPTTGKMDEGVLDRGEIDDALTKGYTVEYK